ncbi:phosphoglycolate phosphatase [Tatumella saanichensis]|uniref:phosphoglycolate phosphatase n=1 Tax=Tatumella saanichensis TaxID=480813 RepID=UPI0004A2760A|nr:phosphoglycolate phosphatase [Tatumella saanichensis]
MAPFTDIRGLAFDLDGTLSDSIPGLAEAVDQALEAMGLPPAGKAHVTTWVGNGADILMQRALLHALGRQPDTAESARGRELFDRFYAQTAETGSGLFPGVRQTLETLRQRGLPLAIVTNKPTPFVSPFLESLGIAEEFSLVIGGDDVPQKKPHPAALFLVLGHFGLLPHQLLFIGDSRNDIQAAKAAGVPCVGLTYGYNYGEPISESHPDQVLDTFDQLLPALGL